MLRSGRDVKREIWASLQATLNPMVKVDYAPPSFLTDLRGSDTSFSIMLRWTSNTLKQEPNPDSDFAKSISSRDQARPLEAERQFFEEVWQSYAAGREKSRQDRLAAETDETKKPQLQADLDAERTADETVHQKLSATASRITPRGANMTFLEDIFSQANGERDHGFVIEIVQNPGNQVETQERWKNQKAIDEERYASLRATAEKLVHLPKNVASSVWDKTFLIRTLTLRAWLTGIWQFQQPESKPAFEALKSKLVKYFSEPQTIERGCDYILENIGKQGDVYPAWVKFFLYGSNGPDKEEKKLNPAEGSEAVDAFDMVSSRINMSSIHGLPVKAEIGTRPGQAFPTDFTEDEVTLMQDQERKAKEIFEQTQK